MSRKALSISQEDINIVIAKSSSMREASILLGVTYSSFIRYAKKIALSNYPDIIQMGDAFQVRNLDWTLEI